jgi:hypothetical protein
MDFFFEFIEPRAFSSGMLMDFISEIKSTKAELQNLNFVIFYLIFMEVFCKMIIFMDHHFFLLFLFEKSSKTGQNIEIPHFWKYIIFLFLIQFWCSFFLWIDCAKRLWKHVEGSPLSLMVSDINSIVRDQQKMNSKIWTFSFFIQFYCSFLTNSKPLLVIDGP